MLVIHKYAKQYGGALVLTIDELKLPSGVYWIKGENGSGKSTLFKSIAGIIPFDGEIMFSDISLRKDPIRYRRLVNYSEAEPLYPAFLTAKDLIRFVGKAKGAPMQQQEFYTGVFGVDQFSQKPCETYSSGMMKKLSLVLGFLGTPGIIILDEPLITLDEEARNILLKQITILAQKGTTFLLSSHQLLDDGSIQLNGTFVIREKTLVHD
jgi:ABC-2 type transport system ATP-binding protein